MALRYVWPGVPSCSNMIQLLVDQYDDLDTMTRDMTVVMKLSPNGILRVDKEVHYKHATS